MENQADDLEWVDMKVNDTTGSDVEMRVGDATGPADAKSDRWIYSLQDSGGAYDVDHIGDAIRRGELKGNGSRAVGVVSFLVNSTENVCRVYQRVQVRIPLKVEGAVSEPHVAYLKSRPTPGLFDVWTRDGTTALVVPPWCVGTEAEELAVRNEIVEARRANAEAFRQRTLPSAGNYGQVDSRAQFCARFPRERFADFEFRTVSSARLHEMWSGEWRKSEYPDNYHGDHDIQSCVYFRDWPALFVAYLRKDPLEGGDDGDGDGFEILGLMARKFLFSEPTNSAEMLKFGEPDDLPDPEDDSEEDSEEDSD